MPASLAFISSVVRELALDELSRHKIAVSPVSLEGPFTENGPGSFRFCFVVGLGWSDGVYYGVNI